MGTNTKHADKNANISVADTRWSRQRCRQKDLVKFAVDVSYCILQSFNGCSRRCRMSLFETLATFLSPNTCNNQQPAVNQSTKLATKY